jgi:hypothetical protein
MGAVSDRLGHPRYGFILATGFAALLFAGLLFNAVANPAAEVLRGREASDYKDPEALT